MSDSSLPGKSAVRRAFGDAAHEYDDHAFLQREIADRLFERLDYIKLTPKRMLDIGCGTGYATALLAKRFPESVLLAFDLAPNMVTATRQRLGMPSMISRLFGTGSRFSYFTADAERLPLRDACIDCAFSNLALQWCDAGRVAEEVARALAPGGLFMFTTFGPDTLKELRAAFRTADADDATPHVNQFPDMHDVGDALLHAGFSDPVMDQEMIKLTYDALPNLLRELKGIGAHNVLPGRTRGLTGKARWQRMTTAYEQYRDSGRLPASFEVVYGHAWKPLTSPSKTVGGAQQISLSDFKRMVRS